MDVRIGVTYSAKELHLELEKGADPAGVKQQVEGVLAAGGVLWLKDHKGREVGVPTEKIAYVEIGSADTERRIGFGGG